MATYAINTCFSCCLLCVNVCVSSNRKTWLMEQHLMFISTLHTLKVVIFLSIDLSQFSRQNVKHSLLTLNNFIVRPACFGLWPSSCWSNNKVLYYKCWWSFDLSGLFLFSMPLESRWTCTRNPNLLLKHSLVPASLISSGIFYWTHFSLNVYLIDKTVHG